MDILSVYINLKLQYKKRNYNATFTKFRLPEYYNSQMIFTVKMFYTKCQFFNHLLISNSASAKNSSFANFDLRVMGFANVLFCGQGSIYEYKGEPFSEADYARDFWVFSYLGNGMNMVDICRLKYKDVKKDTFSFIRHKTKEKNKSCRTVTVPIIEDIALIIEKWGNKDMTPDNFVFPFLVDGLTDHQIHQRVRHRVAKLNSGLKTIGNDLGIEKKLTSYSARHSFATTLKRSLSSTEYISESLGHANLDITKRYLDSFENEQRQEIAKHLTAF